MNLNGRPGMPTASSCSCRAQWKIATALIFSTMLLATNVCYPQEMQNTSWAGYYPLATGNSWTYSVSDKSKARPVVWKVLNVKTDASGPVFAVWPTPSDSDDSGMQLQFTSEGLRELGDDFFVLRFPLTKGKTWSVSRHGQDRVFVVVSEGERCAVGKLKFKACAVVRDDDPAAKLRTVTTYALGVGPVRYEYYKMVREGFAKEATQVVTIVSYSAKPDHNSQTKSR